MLLDLIAQLPQETIDQARQVTEQAANTGIVTTPVQDTLTIWQLISFGGWGIMGPLALMSLITVYVVIERMLALSKANREDRDFVSKVRDYLHEGKVDSARNLCAHSATPMARLVEKGIERMGQNPLEVESAMETVGHLEIAKLERGASLLRLIARLAPLFGFIGTIIGVIKIFYDISLVGDISIAVISKGLYQKMVTSAAGLIVGIIAFAGYHLVTTMSERVIDKMERTSLAFMDLILTPSK
jgi:biopolymer transport protein ExbB